jgi:hypothetical protein
LLVISALSLRFAAFSISWFVATPMCSSLFMVCCYANVLFSFHGLLLRQCALLTQSELVTMERTQYSQFGTFSCLMFPCFRSSQSASFCSAPPISSIFTASSTCA